MRIALATAEQYPELSPDDQVLHAAMKQRGLDAQAVIWDRATDWSRFDVVVVRSIWDYHLKYERYLAWLAALDTSGARVYNPTFVLRWNADKRYLVDLQHKHVRTAPTRVISRADHASLAGVMNEAGWRNAVVKPTVSSTGYETWFVSAPCTDYEEQRFAHQSSRMAVLVQEFVPQVQAGEFSFVFIAGQYTHCILKRAAANDFRVHMEHGGTVEAIKPPASQIEWAESVIATMGEEAWTYARVDAVAAPDGMVLMEFELLDPELFFAYNASACERFIDTVTNG